MPPAPFTRQRHAPISDKVCDIQIPEERHHMQINQLSANIDQKLAELDQQLDNLHKRRAEAQDVTQQEKIARDITVLNKIKLKLLKSKDIAWRAHQMRQEQEDLQRNDRQRLLGLALCIFSAVGAVVLIGIYFWSGLF
jgi:hypothetical protein